MNRLHHLSKTLPRNLADNDDYDGLEFILLDYNSTDGTEDWVRSEMADQIISGRLIYFKTTEPEHFQRSHSRNMAFRVSTGTIICNVDADNFTGPGYAQFINGIFQKNYGIYTVPHFNIRDIIGRFSILRSDFIDSSGYNEQLVGYGFEDIELYKRLDSVGLKKLVFNIPKFSEVIHHSNDERVKYEHIGRNCQRIFVNYIDFHISELLFLYKDHTFELATFKNHENAPVTEDLIEIYHQMISLLGELEGGSWALNEGTLILTSSSDLRSNKFRFSSVSKCYYNRSTARRFYEVTDEKFKNDLMLLKTEVYNRQHIERTMQLANSQVNLNGFGLGKLIKNFKEEIVLGKL